MLGVASGDFAEVSDRLYLLDLATGAQTLVHESTSSFVIGEPAYDPQSEMLYVPDAAENAVLEFAADEGGFIELGSTDDSARHRASPDEGLLTRLREGFGLRLGEAGSAVLGSVRSRAGRLGFVLILSAFFLDCFWVFFDLYLSWTSFAPLVATEIAPAMYTMTADTVD